MNSDLQILIANNSNNALPEYATEGSAGLDLRAFVEKPILLKPLGRAVIPTGLFLALPEGFEAQIRPRSGLAAKHGVTVLNSPGTIDSDYRGEVKIILVNLSEEDFVVKTGERICQMVITKTSKASFAEVTELPNTTRGAGGFGHTGTK